jgi:GTP-binding protein
VVSLGSGRSFVVADIPGVIEGAAQGAGLGLQFLKHLSRTRLLLHLVDVAPLDNRVDCVAEVQKIEQELSRYSTELMDKERWLVLNKRDLLPEDSFQARRSDLLEGLKWCGPVYGVSAVTGEGIKKLIGDLMGRLEVIWQEERSVDEEREDTPWDPLQG